LSVLRHQPSTGAVGHVCGRRNLKLPEKQGDRHPALRRANGAGFGALLSMPLSAVRFTFCRRNLKLPETLMPPAVYLQPEEEEEARNERGRLARRSEFLA
jgi:hypothetical protein